MYTKEFLYKFTWDELAIEFPLTAWIQDNLTMAKSRCLADIFKFDLQKEKVKEYIKGIVIVKRRPA